MPVCFNLTVGGGTSLSESVGLQAAEIKKAEQDRQYERRLQKERKEEDEEFQDKEKFITAAYRQKLIEQKKWDIIDTYVPACHVAGCVYWSRVD
jgi:hypothetical protein